MVLIFAYSGSVDPDHFTDSLGYWQILKSFCEKDDTNVVNYSIDDFAAWISNLKSTNVFVTLKGLVWEGSIEHNSIDVDRLTSNSEFSKFCVIIITFSALFR